MSKRRTLFFAALCLGATLLTVQAATTEVAEITFDSHCTSAITATNGLPGWILGLEQDGGEFLDQPKCWHVDSSQPTAKGRLSVVLDRQLQPEDLALAILYEQDDSADFVVQLFDAENRVIVLDLFGNIMFVGKEAKTDTFIVPLRKFPDATRVTIRRVKGDLKVFGAMLYPVASEVESDHKTLEDLAKLMGDTLSPHSPLRKGRENLTELPTVIVSGSGNHSKTQQVEQTTSNLPGQGQTGDGWRVLPFYGDSDWPASKGVPAMVGKNDVLLQGRPVRTIASYKFPATVECDVVLEQRAANDGSLDLFLIPEDQSLNRYPKPMTNLRIIYSNTGDYGSVDRYDLNQSEPGLVWSHPTSKLEAGKTYHVKMTVAADGTLSLNINGESFPETSKIKVPYHRFQVQIGGWQPTNRWHVRNFRVE